MAHLNLEEDTMSESSEMYLLRIALLQTEGQPVPVPALAHELSVSPVSANEMCRKLTDRGLVHYEPYKGVTLTGPGELLARRVLRCRGLWEVFFVEKLGIRPEEADLMACRFEHVTPDELAERLATYLGYPTFSPLHEVIPYDDQAVLERPLRPLSDLAAGEQGQVIEVNGSRVEQEFLRHQGLSSGRIVEVLATAADGSMMVAVAGERLSLAGAVTAEIKVTPVINSRGK